MLRLHILAYIARRDGTDERISSFSTASPDTCESNTCKREYATNSSISGILKSKPSRMFPEVIS